jgi:VCBS repeat-containing protein
MRPIRLAVLSASTLLAALLLVPTALAGTAMAQAPAPVSFGPAANVATGDGPASIVAGDFNGDGNPDLAVGNQLAGTVSVLLGSSGGSFTRQTPDLAVGGFPTSVAVGDFDGDNDPDLAVSNGFGYVSVLLGGGGASFTRQTPDLTIGDSPWSVAVADFNGDNDPDLAVANQPANNVSVLLGGSGGSFTRQSPDLAVGFGPTSVAVGDFNGDNDPDLAVANQFDGTVSVLLGTAGGGGFSGPTPAGNYSGSDPVSVAVGDFNGDNDPDLAVGDMSPGEILVLLGGAGGSFSGPTATTTFTVDSGVSSVAVGDFNRDADPDLAVANFNSGRVSVLLGGAGSTFTRLTTDPTAGSGSPAVAVGDWNGDGKPDFAVASYNSDTVVVRLNNRAPIAAADAYTTGEDTALTVNAPGVLANDSDPDGNQLSAVLGLGPSHGTLALNANGSFTYTPTANYSGSDSFTYRASDGTLTSNPATVTLTVTAVNDAPTVTVAARGSCGTDDRSGTINLAVDDVESQAASLTLSAASSNSALMPNRNIVFGGNGATRTMTASSVAGRSGTAAVTITVSDGQATSTVTVTVRVGGNGNDTLTGDPGADLLVGQNGNDTVNGGGGNDLVCGGNGNDILSGGEGDDSLGGGGGNDRLTGGPGADRFSGGVGTDAATDFTPAQGDTSDGTIP